LGLESSVEITAQVLLMEGKPVALICRTSDGRVLTGLSLNEDQNPVKAWKNLQQDLPKAIRQQLGTVQPFKLIEWTRIKEVRRTLPRFAGVFPVSSISSTTMRRMVMPQSGQHVCDLGCGMGVNALLAARRGATVVATDINPWAVANTQLNGELTGLSDSIRTAEADLFTAAEGDLGKFDTIYFNPPHTVASERADLSTNDPEHRLVTRFFGEVKDRLNPQGRVDMVLPVSAANLDLIAQSGLNLDQMEEYIVLTYPVAAVRLSPDGTVRDTKTFLRELLAGHNAQKILFAVIACGELKGEDQKAGLELLTQFVEQSPLEGMRPEMLAMLFRSLANLYPGLDAEGKQAVVRMLEQGKAIAAAAGEAQKRLEQIIPSQKAAKVQGQGQTQTLDMRTVNMGLFHKSYVRLFMAMYRIVQSANLPQNGLNVAGGFGADFARYLLSINQPRLLAVDTAYAKLGETELKKLSDPAYLNGGYMEDLDSDYYKNKRALGFAIWDSMGTPTTLVAALAFELHSAGVTRLDKVSRNAYGNIVLEFKWKHLESEEQTYAITLVSGDITDYGKWPQELKDAVSKEKISSYTHNAGISLAWNYAHSKGTSFIDHIYEHLAGNGLMITDDYAQFGEGKVTTKADCSADLNRLGMQEVAIPDFEGIQKEIYSAKLPKLKRMGDPNNYVERQYGWHQRIRIKSAGLAAQNKPVEQNQKGQGDLVITQDFEAAYPGIKDTVASELHAQGYSQKAIDAFVFGFSELYTNARRTRGRQLFEQAHGSLDAFKADTTRSDSEKTAIIEAAMAQGRKETVLNVRWTIDANQVRLSVTNNSEPTQNQQARIEKSIRATEEQAAEGFQQTLSSQPLDGEIEISGTGFGLALLRIQLQELGGNLTYQVQSGKTTFAMELTQGHRAPGSQTEGIPATSPKMNAPLLFRLENIFQKMPLLRQGWMGLQALQVRGYGNADQAIDEAALRADAGLRLLALESYGQIPAELLDALKPKGAEAETLAQTEAKELEQVAIGGVITRQKHGTWNWLIGQVLGYAERDQQTGAMTFYLPAYLSRVLQNKNKSNYAAWEAQQAWAQNLLQHMVNYQGLKQTSNLIAEAGMRPALATREMAPAEVGKSLAEGYSSYQEAGMTSADYAAQLQGTANITSSQLIAMSLRLLPALQTESRLQLENLVKQWVAKKPTSQTLMDALESLGKSHDPAIAVLQAMVKQSAGLKGEMKSVIEDGVLSNLTTLLAAEPAMQAQAQAPRNTNVTGVQVMGMPAESAELVIALEAARQSMAADPQWAGNVQALDAVIAAIKAGQGKALDSLTPLVETAGTTWAGVLAGMMGKLPDFETGKLRTDFNEHVYLTNAGFRNVPLAPGVNIAVCRVVETASDQADAAAIREQVQKNKFPEGTVARVFTQRANPAPVRDVAPGLARVMGWMAQGLAGRAGVVGRVFSATAMALAPVQAWQQSVQRLATELKQPALGQALANLDLNSKDPLAIAYREMIHNHTSQSRAELDKVLIRMIGAAQDERTGTAEELQTAAFIDWMTVSEFLGHLGGIPMLEMASVDMTHPLYRSLPAELRGKKVSIPVALLEAKQCKGALGYAIKRMEKGVFVVDKEIIRLFLHHGLLRFGAAA
jgi:methylase of polypeptide subunit release factors